VVRRAVVVDARRRACALALRVSSTTWTDAIARSMTFMYHWIAVSFSNVPPTCARKQRAALTTRSRGVEALRVSQ